MSTLLTAPVLSPSTTGTKPITGSAAMVRRQIAVQPRARILYVDDEPQLSVLAHNARSVQPYLHGGINE